MNAIVGLTDLLLQEKVEGQVLENLLSIRQSADNLLVIINDILDFSKIEAGKLAFESIDFSIRNIVGHLLRTLDYKFREKGIGFLATIDPNLPEVLVGDPYRLNQILINLVGNALKFTNQGQVQILVSLLGCVERQYKVQFTVKDTGIGIPKNRLNSIFEQFNQGSADVARHYGGTGLGLAITKQLIDLQNGTMMVDSEDGKGSAFSFVLSFKESKRIALEAPSASVAGFPDLIDCKFLVCEDNLINQRVITQVLEKCHASVTLANNGQIGLDLLSKANYHAVFMDLQMPEMDGYLATELIRGGSISGVDANIPIIALTADALPETRTKVLHSGFTDFLPKPFRKEDLFAVINKVLLK
jgi:CheY-like chemotaxis protein